MIGKKIDSFMPVGTKRGEFKKITTASIYLIKRDGIKNFTIAIITKLRRGEFNLRDASYSIGGMLPVDRNNFTHKIGGE